MSLHYKKISKNCIPIATLKNAGEEKIIYLQCDNTEGEQRISTKIGNFFPLITGKNKDQRQVFFIAGPSGCGKTTFAVNLWNDYHKMYKNRPVFLLSMLKKDATIDVINPLRIKLKTLVDRPLELEAPDDDIEEEVPIEQVMLNGFHHIRNTTIANSYQANNHTELVRQALLNKKKRKRKEQESGFIPEIHDCMVIADDVDTIPNKKIKKAVLNTIETIAITGRRYNISLIMISHYLSNYAETRLIHMESNFLVAFPQYESEHHFNRVLDLYYGVNEEDRQYIKESGSRWCCITKCFPKYCILEDEIFILNQHSVRNITSAANARINMNTKNY